MLTGGQFMSEPPSGVASVLPGGVPGIGACAGWLLDDDPPPNRLLKRSVKDCADAGRGSRPLPMHKASAADTATLRYLRDGNAVMIPRLSSIRNLWLPNRWFRPPYSSAMAANPR